MSEALSDFISLAVILDQNELCVGQAYFERAKQPRHDKLQKLASFRCNDNWLFVKRKRQYWSYWCMTCFLLAIGVEFLEEAIFHIFLIITILEQSKLKILKCEADRFSFAEFYSEPAFSKLHENSQDGTNWKKECNPSIGEVSSWLDSEMNRGEGFAKNKGNQKRREENEDDHNEEEPGEKAHRYKYLNLFMAFNPDSRNLGGRQEIVDLLNNHHLSLLNMKATMNTRGPAFRFAKSKKNLYDDQFKQVRATFEAIRNIKGGTDSKRPKTFGLARKFHSFQKQNYELVEHQRNTKSLQQRLLRIGSMTERKKNPYDPIANPALFFRKAGDSDKSTSLISYAKRIRLNDRKNMENNMYAFQTVYYSPGHHSPRSKGSILGSPMRKAYRSATASNFYVGDDSSLTRSPIRRIKPAAVSRSFEPKKVEKRRESQGGVLIPVVPGSGQDAYLTLKNKIVDSIIEHRLFKQEQLEAFFRRCVDQNVHLDGQRIREICEEIKADLNS